MPKLKQNELHTITKIVTSMDDEKTFSYTKEIQGVKGEHAIFIMLYPTRNAENFHVEDSTSMHIQNHIRELGLGSYMIVNLFSAVTKSRLSTRGLAVDEENLIYLKEHVLSKIEADNTKVIVAWGNSHLTSHAVNQSKKRLLEMWEELHQGKPLYQLTADGMDKDNYGVHPLYMGIRYNNAEWTLSSYPLKKILKELQKEGENKSEDKEKSKSKRQNTKKVSQ